MGLIYKLIFLVSFFVSTISFADTVGAISVVDYVQTLNRQNYIIKSGIIDEASSGNNLLVTAVTDRKICVLSYSYVVAGSVIVKFRSNSTDITGPYTWVANTGIAEPKDGSCLIETAVGQALNMNLNGAVQVGGRFKYAELP